MNPTKTLATAASAAVLLILPAGAAAATPGLFSSGGAKARGFSLSISAQHSSTQGGPTTTAGFTLFRSRRSGSESYSLSATKKVTYRAKANLSSATLKASWGSYGRISMRFHATGRTSSKVPKGCKGKAGKSRPGVLKGALKVRLDKHYFRTIKRTSVPAVLATSGTLTCTVGGFKFPKTKLTLSAFPAGQTASGTSFTVSKNVKGGVSEQASDSKLIKATGITLSRFLTASGKASAFTAASNLASAKVKGIGPVFGGSARFTALGTVTSSFATGTLRGSLVAKFVAGGHARPPKRGVVTLSKS